MIAELEYYCYPCLVRQALDMLSELDKVDNTTKRDLIRATLKFIYELPHEIPPVEAGKRLSMEVARLTGVKDPFETRKRLFNLKALEITPKIKELLQGSINPLEAAIRISVIANLIDFGALSPKMEDLKGLLNFRNYQFEIDDSQKLLEYIDKARSIVILGDNAGEIVFDMLMIEELVNKKKAVTYIVRGGPILNDATIEDALYVGIDKICNVESTGDNLPGIFFDNLPAKVKSIISNCDLVISKGQGNFESFKPNCKVVTFYLLVAKCKLISTVLGVSQGSMVVLCKEPE